jgi:uncharacterized protein
MMFPNVTVKEKTVGNIPCLLMHPDTDMANPTLLLYHGWGSSKENQLFLGSILAAQGFSVIAPDAPRHGQRASIDFSAPVAVRKYFWEVVLEATEEAATLLSTVQGWRQVDGSRIAVAGISMGSFIGSAVFMDAKELMAGVFLLGCGAWVNAARRWDPEKMYPTAAQWSHIQRVNPIGRPEAVNGRPVLLLHGDADPVVSVELQREYYQVLSSHPAGHGVRLVETLGLGHFLELDMIETASEWLRKNMAKEGEV